MLPMKRPRLSAVQALPDYRLALTFIDWRARTGLSLNQAAEALGVSTPSITRYSSGREAVPRSLALACLGWDFLQQQANAPRAAQDTGRYIVTRKISQHTAWAVHIAH